MERGGAASLTHSGHLHQPLTIPVILNKNSINFYSSLAIKALPTTRWTKTGGSVPMPAFWSTIWKKYKKTWTEGLRRLRVKRRAFHAACAGPFLVRTAILFSYPIFIPSFIRFFHPHLPYLPAGTFSLTSPVNKSIIRYIVL